MALYELRQYKVRPGQMETWLKTMEEEIIPMQTAAGIVICASFRGEDDDSVYCWIRRFEDEADREAKYAAIYDTDFWKNDMAPRLTKILDREAMVVTRLTPTAMSVLQ